MLEWSLFGEGPVQQDMSTAADRALSPTMRVKWLPEVNSLFVDQEPEQSPAETAIKKE